MYKIIKGEVRKVRKGGGGSGEREIFFFFFFFFVCVHLNKTLFPGHSHSLSRQQQTKPRGYMIKSPRSERLHSCKVHLKR